MKSLASNKHARGTKDSGDSKIFANSWLSLINRERLRVFLTSWPHFRIGTWHSCSSHVLRRRTDFGSPLFDEAETHLRVFGQSTPGICHNKRRCSSPYTVDWSWPPNRCLVRYTDFRLRHLPHDFLVR